jgi:putative ABC transport system ATP-binding protein
VHEPSFVLADEPTGNLDSKTTTSLMDLLATLNSDGRTVILITHDPKVAAMSKRQIVIKDGRVEGDSLS